MNRFEAWKEEFVKSEAYNEAEYLLYKKMPYRVFKKEDHDQKYEILKEQILESCYYSETLPSLDSQREQERSISEIIKDKGRNPLKAASELVNFLNLNLGDPVDSILLNTSVKMKERGIVFNSFKKDLGFPEKERFKVTLQCFMEALEEYEIRYDRQHWFQYGRMVYPKTLTRSRKNPEIDHLIAELTFLIIGYISVKPQPIWNKPLPIPKGRLKGLNEVIQQFVKATFQEDYSPEQISERIKYLRRNDVKLVGDDWVADNMWSWLK